MKKFNQGLGVLPVVLVLALIGLITFAVLGGVGNKDGIGNSQSAAAVSADLSTAGNFGILASTYTNTVAGTTVNGDVGFTTGPAVAPTVSGTTHTADGTYNTAGTDQGNALSSLNAQTCDFNFSSATDLSLLPQPLTPGVYCITAAASIGTGGITLNGAGTYIFRINGALTSVANSNVTLSGGASACDVFWTPTSATTLGANSSFIGTDIDAAGITVGSTVTWEGRALAFGGTVTTNVDTINTPSCSTPTPEPEIVTPEPEIPTPSVPEVIPDEIVPLAPTPVPVVTPPTLPKTGFSPK
jgi:hypothetical protein